MTDEDVEKLESEDSSDIVVRDTLELVEQQVDAESERLLSLVNSSTSSQELQDLTNLFNISQKKKEMLRIKKLDGLMDAIIDNIDNRLSNYEYMEDKDLIGYMKVVQNSIDKSSSKVNEVSETPSIQFNQQNINVKVGDGIDLNTVSRESREKVVDFINNFLKAQQQTPANVGVEFSNIFEDENEDN